MKISLCHRRERGVTLIELCVVMAVITVFLLFYLLQPRNLNGRARATRIQCVNNLKQIGLATRVWEGDHGYKYPWSVSSTNGGTMEFASGLNAWRHFQVTSNDLGTLKVLVCPEDRQRPLATNFFNLSNSNLSYFVGIESSEIDPQGIMFGDRNVTNGTAVQNGILTLTADRPAGWTDEIHHQVGNVVLADGSVQQISGTGLRMTVANATANVATNHLLMPVLTP